MEKKKGEKVPSDKSMDLVSIDRLKGINAVSIS